MTCLRESAALAMLPSRLKSRHVNPVVASLVGVYGAHLQKLSSLAAGEWKEINRSFSPNNGLVTRGL
jgi:hypothetical protein